MNMIGTRMRRGALVAIAGLALAVAACGGDNDDTAASGTPTATGDTSVSGSLSIIGVWTGDEQKSFQAVLDGFAKKYPSVDVKYTSAGDNVPTVLGTAVEGGNPPDLAAIAQPGVVAQFQAKGALQPIEFARSEIEGNYTPDFVKLGTIDDKLYSFVFKAANKSTVWFNVDAFKNAGISPPADWKAFLENADTLKASGVRAYSIAGADGWTLTDLFENIYLRQAGPEKYDQLADHELKWTDQSVKSALTTMAQVLGDADNIAGGTSGALQTDFPTSVSNVFQDSPKAAQVLEGDFVPGVVSSKTSLEPKSGYDVYPFPPIEDSGKVVVGGGDSIVMFKDSPAAQALVTYLASPEAAEIWVKRGGFSSPNNKVPAEAYPDEITRTTATAIASADAFRFDMSDLAPAAFGGTAGQGEWKLLQDFMAKPSSVDATASKLEAAAAKAYR
jgi:ABC-type glycerol-3-phosphate transport system substrate-binding protein